MLRIGMAQRQNLAFGAEFPVIIKAMGNRADFKNDNDYLANAVIEVDRIARKENMVDAGESFMNMQKVGAEIIREGSQESEKLGIKIISAAARMLFNRAEGIKTSTVEDLIENKWDKTFH